MLGLIMKNEKIEVYADVGLHIAEPWLYVVVDGERTSITTPSSYYENEIGEFMISKNVSDDILKQNIYVMNEIADLNTIEHLKDLSWIKFKLKEEYLNRLIEHIDFEREERIKA